MHLATDVGPSVWVPSTVTRGLRSQDDHQQGPAANCRAMCWDSISGHANTLEDNSNQCTPHEQSVNENLHRTKGEVCKPKLTRSIWARSLLETQNLQQDFNDSVTEMVQAIMANSPSVNRHSAEASRPIDYKQKGRAGLMKARLQDAAYKHQRCQQTEEADHMQMHRCHRRLSQQQCLATVFGYLSATLCC